jgi:hypothetical protein
MPTGKTPFEPQSERKLKFREKEIYTADLKDGRGYVSLNSLCDAFGLDRRGQRQRLKRQQGYFEPFTATIKLKTGGGAQPTLCLTASAVPLFLTGIQLERVENAEARELLSVFLDEAHIVLAEHFGISERGEIDFLREAVSQMVSEQDGFERGLEKKVERELEALRKEHKEKINQIRQAFGSLREDVRQI